MILEYILMTYVIYKRFKRPKQIKSTILTRQETQKNQTVYRLPRHTQVPVSVSSVNFRAQRQHANHSHNVIVQ